ncbi:MAG: RidA family protein [Ginsengibacter sp.]
MDKKIIKTDQAPDPIGPYSQAVQASGMLFISGQIALKPGTSKLITGNIADEATQVMNNLKAILTEAGLGFNHVIKTTIFLKDMDLFAAVNSIYGEFFESDFPARETVAVKGLPKDVNVEISMIAAL